METITKQTKKQRAIEFLKSKPFAKHEIFHTLDIISYSVSAIMPENDVCCAVFQGRGHRPYKNYRFKTKEDQKKFNHE